MHSGMFAATDKVRTSAASPSATMVQVTPHHDHRPHNPPVPHELGNDPRLRPVRLEDADAVAAARASDPELSRQMPVHDLATARTYLQRLVEDPDVAAMAVTDRDGTAQGLVAVAMDRTNRSGWFWYWLAPRARRRGWASRAAATLATWALTLPSSSNTGPTGGALHRLELGHRVNNPASGAIARAAGFVLEGRERDKFWVDGRFIDVLTYSRLESDPVPLTPTLPMQPPEVEPCGRP